MDVYRVKQADLNHWRPARTLRAPLWANATGDIPRWSRPWWASLEGWNMGQRTED